MGILPDGQGKDIPYELPERNGSGTGESIRIGCKNYDGTEALMNVNFNLKKGKKVMLAYAGTGIKEEVELPDLGMEQGVYRKTGLPVFGRRKGRRSMALEYRNELKYVVSSRQIAILRNRIRPLMALDAHTGTKGNIR